MAANPQPALANPKCPHCGRSTQQHQTFHRNLESGGTCKIAYLRCRDHKFQAYLVLTCHGEPAKRLGFGVLEWTCKETGMRIRTRKRGTPRPHGGGITPNPGHKPPEYTFRSVAGEFARPIGKRGHG